MNCPTTIFILNLAFSDFIYCAVNLPMYSYYFLYQKWDWGLKMCKIAVNIRGINSYAAWLSVAMVAVSRCLVVTNSRKCATLFSCRRNQIVIIILIWIYATALNLPSDFEVKKSK